MKAKKFDKDKTMWHVMPWRALNAAAEVMTFGAKKYGELNYLQGETIGGRRYFSACLRHLLKVLGGTWIDEESGFPHLAHAGCCLLMWLEVELKKIEREEVEPENITPEHHCGLEGVPRQMSGYDILNSWYVDSEHNEVV